MDGKMLICPVCGKSRCGECHCCDSIKLVRAPSEIEKLKKKLEQRDDFIDDVYAVLKNSNSKLLFVEVLLSRCEQHINARKLGVI